MGDPTRNRTGGRPAVTIHYAQTLDGRIATRQGQSQWISGESSLQLAHRLRACHAAVLVGVGTVVADDPRLTVRLVSGRSPVRVVVDSTLRLPLTANVLTDGAATTVIATTDRASEARVAEVRRLGAEVLVLGQDAEGRVALEELLRTMMARDVASVLVEGGRAVITELLRRRLVQRVIVCIAPKILGSGVEAVGELNSRCLADALTFTEVSFTPLGEDLIFDGRLSPAPPQEPPS
jgi:diaminohydroxyphosphoribosylaminopyrimidine deaminase / 5-amino-6-(5-phosphoribosylamino)uracil reductase